MYISGGSIENIDIYVLINKSGEWFNAFLYI
jgi:hypothetical protein